VVLKPEFYKHKDTKKLARQLLGKFLCTNFNGIYTSGMITETEAYEGTGDKASHAYGGRFTERTKTMYAAGGIAYVYLCYGLHTMFNIVTHEKGEPHAILCNKAC
jgi:DNA-3-methyladenine glycosylase